MLVENSTAFFHYYLPLLPPNTCPLHDDLAAALELEDRPHATSLKRMLELATCITLTARTMDARRPRPWLHETTRKMLTSIDAIRQSPVRLRMLTLCLSALLSSKNESDEHAKLLPLLLSATARLDEAHQAPASNAASALMYTRTKSVLLTLDAPEFTWTCDAAFAQGFMLYITRVRLPGHWRLKVKSAQGESLIHSNINWCMHTDALQVTGTAPLVFLFVMSLFIYYSLLLL